MQSKDLTVGLSGCTFELNNGILRKIAPTPKYNNRLWGQIRKQNMFLHFPLRNISAPAVIDTVFHDTLYDNRAYVDMYYIPAISMREFLLKSSVAEINSFIDALFEYFDYSFKQSHDEYRLDSFKQEIFTKLNQLAESSQYPSVCEAVENETKYLSNIKLPRGFCHGDLTLENILFYKNKFYFIDFLDSFIDSPVVDLVKLKQDLYHGWFLKNIDLIDLNLRINQAREYIWNKLLERYSNKIITVEFRILERMNFLRIEPYLQTDHDRLQLKNIICQL
jgi:hypothetical protein